MEDDRLVVSWYYSHTGGLLITSADVFFKPDTSSDPAKAFSDVTGSSLADLSAMNRQDSIPLPEAGLHYEFTVRAGNSEGEAQANCPSLRLDTGELPLLLFMVINPILFVCTTVSLLVNNTSFPHTLTCYTGIPARPAPPEVTGSDPATVTVSTQHSGVADSAVDQFRFVIEVDHTVQCVCQCVGECIGMDGCVCLLGYCQCKGFVVLACSVHSVLSCSDH